MNHLNSILIEGVLTNDPSMTETPRGAKVCTFHIASNRYFRKDDAIEEETSFLTIECWGKIAESCAENLTKGRGVRAVGRIKQDRWTGADGEDMSAVKVIAEHVEFKPIAKPVSVVDGGGVFMKCEILSQEQAKDRGCVFEFWNRGRRAMCACGKTPVATVAGHAFCVECLPDVLIRVGSGSYSSEPNAEGYDRYLATKEDFLIEAKRVHETRATVTA